VKQFEEISGKNQQIGLFIGKTFENAKSENDIIL
jgi:hypothetical protein